MQRILNHSPSRLTEIEQIRKAENPGQTKPFFSAALGGKLLRVSNHNGSSFVMAMPRGDSPIIEGLAARKAQAKAEENSFNKAFSHLEIK